MTRGGRDKTRDDPERRCIVTGETGPKLGLVRFVADPDGRIVPDVAEKLPGRGIWVTARGDLIDKAVEKGLFSRGARAPVTVPADLRAEVEALLVRRVTDLVSMARKAGRAVAGFEKVKGWLGTGEAVFLLQASDGSERGKQKLRAPGGQDTFSQALTASELGLSFGREHVIHAALAAGGLTDRIKEDAARLSGVRRKAGDDPRRKGK